MPRKRPLLYVKIDPNTNYNIKPGALIPIEPLSYIEVKIPEYPRRFDALLIENYSLKRADPYYLYKNEEDIWI